MAWYVMRVEGVNFDSTIDDTQDLSCIRGSGLALLHAPRRIAVILHNTAGVVTPSLLHEGASQCAFSFAAANDADAEAAAATVRAALAQEGDDPDELDRILRQARGDPGTPGRPGALPLAHLSFVVDIAAAAGADDAAIGEALVVAEARNRARQLRSATVRPPRFGTGAQYPDELGGILPGDTILWLPADDVTARIDEAAPAAGGQNRPKRVSRSVAARRHYGRRMRQVFYRVELGEAAAAPDLLFTNSLQAICEQPPTDVPEPVRNKIAVFYADGNRFGKIRDRLAGQQSSAQALDRFSRELQQLRRQHLLRPLAGALRAMLSAADAQVRRRVALPVGGGDALRFETLMWGGDELLWVAPAWLGLWLAGTFFTLTRSWQIDGVPLTHGAGLVICDRKTPIRTARAVAKALADGAKAVNAADADLTALRSAIAIEVFESADLPDHALDRHRCALYPGLDQAFADAGCRAAALALTADDFTNAVDRIGTMKAEDGSGFPRSQLYKLLHQAVAGQAFAGGAADTALGLALGEYLANAGRGQDRRSGDFTLWPDDRAQRRPLALSLALAAQYWDFVDVFKVPLPMVQPEPVA